MVNMDYLTLAINIATSAAPVAACVAVWEMRAQRRSAYAPRLAIDDTSLQLVQDSSCPKWAMPYPYAALLSLRIVGD
jgi:hypothetical protein